MITFKHLIMKNYLKILSLSTMCLLIACNKDDEQVIKEETVNFFNLKTGNYWVYKNYDGDSIQNMKFSNTLDSVVLTDKFTFDKKDYFRKETFYKNVDANTWNSKSVYYISVNSKGHLITVGKDPRESNNQKEYTTHPGTDKDFSYQEEIIYGGESYGIVICKSENNQTINVEGKDYVSYPYIWRLQPNEKVKKELVSEFHYAKNVGLVKETTPMISGSFIIEKRLTSFKN